MMQKSILTVDLPIPAVQFKPDVVQVNVFKVMLPLVLGNRNKGKH